MFMGASVVWLVSWRDALQCSGTPEGVETRRAIRRI
jgi:hypothetical protein